MVRTPPRIGIVGLFGECNAFRAAIPADVYQWMAYHEGTSLLAAVAEPNAFLLPETRGFFAGMGSSGPWEPVPLVYAASASGPALDEALLDRLFRRLDVALRDAGPLDAIYVCGHGSVVGTATKDVDAALLQRLRKRLGPDVPIVETLDPHGKITAAMIDQADILVSYRTDPHVDNHDRGVEAALHLRRLLRGDRPHVAWVRLPMMLPTIAIVAATSPFRPAVELGQARRGDRIANVSILPSYPWTDTPHAGFHIVVSGWSADATRELALELGEFIWARREGFRVEMLGPAALVETVNRLNRSPDLPSLCFADVADNPGGGARGNTVHALQALRDARARSCLIGALHDPAVAAEAHAAGIGAQIDVVFNRNLDDPFSKPLAARAHVIGLADGQITARRGVARGVTLHQGPTAALRIDDLTVVVNSNCLQTLAVEQLEIAGLAITDFRAVVLKSRGHYQGSFDEFFSRDRMIELDLPGWVTPHLETLPYQHVPRPLFPLDPQTTWTGGLTHFKPGRD